MHSLRKLVRPVRSSEPSSGQAQPAANTQPASNGGGLPALAIHLPPPAHAVQGPLLQLASRAEPAAEPSAAERKRAREIARARTRLAKLERDFERDFHGLHTSDVLARYVERIIGARQALRALETPEAVPGKHEIFEELFNEQSASARKLPRAFSPLLRALAEHYRGPGVPRTELSDLKAALYDLRASEIDHPYAYFSRPIRQIQLRMHQLANPEQFEAEYIQAVERCKRLEADFQSREHTDGFKLRRLVADLLDARQDVAARRYQDEDVGRLALLDQAITDAWDRTGSTFDTDKWIKEALALGATMRSRGNWDSLMELKERKLYALLGGDGNKHAIRAAVRQEKSSLELVDELGKQPEAVRSILQDYMEGRRTTPLHVLAARPVNPDPEKATKERATLQALVGDHLNDVDDDGYTPLLVAAAHGRKDVIEFLLKDPRLDPRVEGLRVGHEDPYNVAAANGHHEVLDCFESRRPTKGGASPFVMLFKNDQLAATDAARLKATFTKLMEDKVDVNAGTPLLWAVQRGFIEEAERLIEAGADFRCKDGEGHTLLCLAAERGSERMMKKLLGLAPDLIDTVGADGKTPAMWAARGGHMGIVEQLEKCGANFQLKDREGNTVVTYLRLQVQAARARLG